MCTYTHFQEGGRNMKRLLAAFCSCALVVSLFGCGNAAPAETTEPAPSFVATQAEIDQLEKLYEGLIALHGEFHNHADTGGTSDGKVDLRTWKDTMQYISDMDFAAIVDHKQVLHMRLPEWDNTWFVGGSEAATSIGDLSDQCTQSSLHYNMIFAHPEQLEAVLYEFATSYQYQNDHFKYPGFKKAEFMRIVKSIQDNGGFFSNVHPLYDKYLGDIFYMCLTLKKENTCGKCLNMGYSPFFRTSKLQMLFISYQISTQPSRGKRMCV